MKKAIVIILTTTLLISCEQNDMKHKELELKERELNLREKELALNKKDTTDYTNLQADTIKKINSKKVTETSIKATLPFVGVKYFSFIGGSGGGMRIIIRKDKSVLITNFYSRERDKDIKLNTYYKGVYKEVMNGFKIKGNKIMLVGKACEEIAGGLNCDGVSLSN